MDNHILLSIAGIGVLGIACQWFAWWVRIPSILFLLTAGILAGPILGLLNPDMLLGDLLFPFVSLSVAVILFEGSLTLKFQDIRGHGKTVSNLVTIGALITWAIVGYSTYRLLDLSIELAFLFGAIVVVTGPTVISPLLKRLRFRRSVSTVLEAEGVLLDAIGAVLAVVVLEIALSPSGLSFVKGFFHIISRLLSGVIFFIKFILKKNFQKTQQTIFIKS